MFFKIKVYIINIIRKLTKSIGKKEKKIIYYLKYLRWKKNFPYKDILWDENYLNKFEFNNVDYKDILPKKIAICICFYFNESKLDLLSQTCNAIYTISNNIDLTIITNANENKKKEQIIKSINCNFKKFEIYNPPLLVDERLLPWFHLEIMKNKILDNEFTHFMYLEDDILINQSNILYWIKAREVLKFFNLIPSFIRTEINHNDNFVYAADQVERNNFLRTPRIKSTSSDIVFANIKSPYHAMYLMDKDLMKEHLLGPSRSVDFGHTVFNPRYQNFELLLFDMMAKANLGLIYKDIPDGFFHRSVVPVNKNTKRVEKYCLIKHLSNKYANEKNNKYLGNIKIEDIYY